MCLFIFIGHLHDSVILLLPESFKVLLFCANKSFCYWNLTGPNLWADVCKYQPGPLCSVLKVAIVVRFDCVKEKNEMKFWS